MKQRRETTFKEKVDFAMKLRNIDPHSGTDRDDNENNAQQAENNISHLFILSQAKMYLKANLNFDKLSEENLLNCGEEFLQTLTF